MAGLWALGAATLSTGAKAAEAQRIWIGTYSQRGSEGIYALALNPETGALDAPPALAARADSPSFLALSPDRKTLFAVNESGRFEGKPVGAVVAFAVDAKAGRLTELNRAGTGGAAPCHLAVDPSGRCLVVANYSDGNAAAFPIAEGGKLAAMSQLVKHEGSGPNEKRQKSPHAHGVTFAPAGDMVFIPDLGIDQVKAYRLDAAAGKLEALDSATARPPPGAGPRHFAFHPGGTFAYSINELFNDVTQFAWDPSAKSMKTLGSVSTLPADYKGGSSCAEIAVHPGGRFLYGSNRGHNSIAVFSLDPKTGVPSLIQNISSGGKAPRSFSLDPAGKFLLAANQDSDNIIVLKVDAETGKLTDTGHSAKVPVPVCVLFQ